jgi:hypothetical protein
VGKYSRLQQALTGMHGLEHDANAYKWKVRASSFPICSRFYALHMLYHNMSGIKPSQPDKFILDVTADAGTNVHRVYQRWLGRMGVLFGHWECSSCGITHYDRVGPVYCMNCSRECEYQEMEFIDSVTGYSGHGDGLYPVYPSDPMRELLLFDIKTAKEQDMDKKLAKEFLDRVWKKWMAQTGSYVYHLRNHLRYNVTGTLILVVNRNRPWRSRLVVANDAKPEAYLKAVKAVLSTEDAVRHFLKTRDPSRVVSLKGPCETRRDAPECPWNGACFSKHLKLELKVLLNEHLPEDRLRREIRRAREEDSGRACETPDPLRCVIRGFSQ